MLILNTIREWLFTIPLFFVARFPDWETRIRIKLVYS